MLALAGGGFCGFRVALRGCGRGTLRSQRGRAMSEQEFERLFREEAGALLALPEHPNLAHFITFDASAQPKPLLGASPARLRPWGRHRPSLRAATG